MIQFQHELHISRFLLQQHPCCLVSISVSIYSGYSNKYYRLGSLWKTKTDFSRFCRLGSPRSDVGGGPVFLFIDSSLLLCPQVAKGTRYLFRVHFIRALILFMKAELSWLSHLPETPLSNTITLRVKISTYEWKPKIPKIFLALFGHY